MNVIAVPKVNTFDKQLGITIRRERIRRGLAQQDLARAIGVTYQQVHKYEAGTNRISACRLHAIAVALGLTMEDLVPASPSTDPGLGDRDRLGLEVARNFSRITNTTQRQAVGQLVRVLADGLAGAEGISLGAGLS